MTPKTCVIAVDFDGTIVEHDYPKLGRAVPGALEWLTRYQAAGARLMLWTMRSGGDQHPYVLADAVSYLVDRGVKLFGVNENPEQDWSTSPKQYAHLYIDDAAFGCPLIMGGNGRPMADWSIIGPAVMKFIPTGKWEVRGAKVL
jgi:hypothetical protein